MSDRSAIVDRDDPPDVAGASGSAGPEMCVVRVWLPDRPGALGQVASRIGAVRGDVVGIDILERGGGRAIDELTVTLPEPGLIDLLVAEIVQVDGVAVEDVRPVGPDRADGETRALEIAARLVDTLPGGRREALVDELRGAFDADWVVVLDGSPSPEPSARAASGESPELTWLNAFLAGSSHLSPDEQAAGAPGDLAWTPLGEAGDIVVVGRGERPFHARERRQIDLLGRIASGLLGQVSSAH